MPESVSLEVARRRDRRPASGPQPRGARNAAWGREIVRSRRGGKYISSAGRGQLPVAPGRLGPARHTGGHTHTGPQIPARRRCATAQHRPGRGQRCGRLGSRGRQRTRRHRAHQRPAAAGAPLSARREDHEDTACGASSSRRGNFPRQPGPWGPVLIFGLPQSCPPDAAGSCGRVSVCARGAAACRGRGGGECESGSHGAWCVQRRRPVDVRACAGTLATRMWRPAPRAAAHPASRGSREVSL